MKKILYTRNINRRLYKGENLRVALYDTGWEFARCNPPLFWLLIPLTNIRIVFWWKPKPEGDKA